MKSHECNHVNSKLGQTNLIFFFERELENYVDTENEVCLAIIDPALVMLLMISQLTLACTLEE